MLLFNTKRFIAVDFDGNDGSSTIAFLSHILCASDSGRCLVSAGIINQQLLHTFGESFFPLISTSSNEDQKGSCV